MPSVTTNGGIFAQPTSTPFTAPHSAPEASAASIISGMEFVTLKVIIVTPVHSTRADPMERSICPVMMTKAMPSAIVPTMQVF